MAKQPGWAARLFDQAMDTVGDAITQARFELVDRGWFGRYPHGTGPGQHHDQHSMAEQLGWSQPQGMEGKAQAWDTLCRQIVSEIGRDEARDVERRIEPGQDQDIDR